MLNLFIIKYIIKKLILRTGKKLVENLEVAWL